MSLHEWSIRLGIYSVEDVKDGLVDEMELGIPGEDFRHEEDVAWGYLTGTHARYHYARVFAYEILDPVLRLCHVFLLTNVLGTSTAYSKVPSTALYLLWCIVKKRKVHLGFWIAHSINTISHSPARHLTLCHFLAHFLAENFSFAEPRSLTSSPQTPLPHLFDLEFLRNAGIIRMVNEVPSFYKPGENPNSILSRSDSGNEKGKGPAEKRLRRMERQMERLAEKQEQQAAEQAKALKTQAAAMKKLQKGLADLIGQFSKLAKAQLEKEAPAHESDTSPDGEDEVPADASPISTEDVPPPPPEKKKTRAPRNTRGR